MIKEIESFMKAMISYLIRKTVLMSSNLEDQTKIVEQLLQDLYL